MTFKKLECISRSLNSNKKHFVFVSETLAILNNTCDFEAEIHDLKLNNSLITNSIPNNVC